MKYLHLLTILCCALLLFGCDTVSEISPLRVGLLLYDTDDTFISTAHNMIESQALSLEKEKQRKISIISRNAKGNQLTQTEQLKALIERKVDVLCVNIVERTMASQLIDLAKSADIPIIFFNRQPVDEDLNRWEKCYYIGLNGEAVGRLQGQAVLSKWIVKDNAIDRNGDGVLQYVFLEGEPGHQDTLLRTESAIKVLEDAKIPIQRLGGGVANWKRSEATSIMKSEIVKYGKNIEVVFSNNDDMALGAIDAIKSANLGYMPLVVGVDGMEQAEKSIGDGELYATVLYDAKRLSEEIIKLAVSLSDGEIFNQKITWLFPKLIYKDNIGY